MKHDPILTMEFGDDVTGDYMTTSWPAPTVWYRRWIARIALRVLMWAAR